MEQHTCSVIPTVVKTALQIAALVTVLVATATAQETTGTGRAGENECGQLETKRSEAARRGDASALGALSRRYVETCRMSREKDAVALAMGDRATAARLMKQPLQALDMAQGCINFQYVTVVCHAEKARALAAMRMGRSAAEVVATGYGVAERAEEAAEHEIKVAMGNRSAMKAEEFKRRIAMARWRLDLIAEGRIELAKAEKEIEQVASVQRSN